MLMEELSQIDAYLKKMVPQLSHIQESDSNFASELTPFITQVKKGYESLSQKKKSIRDQYKEICQSFGEDHLRTKPEDILESISSFMKSFSCSLAEYRRKQERELVSKQRKKVLLMGLKTRSAKAKKLFPKDNRYKIIKLSLFLESLIIS